MADIQLNFAVTSEHPEDVATFSEKTGAEPVGQTRDFTSMLALGVSAAGLVKTLLEIWKLARDLRAKSPAGSGPQPKVVAAVESGEEIDLTAVDEQEVANFANRILVQT